MTPVVLDTSAIIRLYIPDGPIPQGLEGCIESAWKAESTIFIPELALAEVAQVLWKKEQAGYITKPELDDIIASVMALPLKIAGHFHLLTDSLIIARRHKLTVYDALFLALAVKMKARLITADQKLGKIFEKLP